MCNEITRYVCAEKGELHYSSTPDLMTYRCPICDAPVVPVDINTQQSDNGSSVERRD